MPLGQPTQGSAFDDQVGFQEHESSSFQGQDGLFLLLIVSRGFRLHSSKLLACFATMWRGPARHEVRNPYTPFSIWFKCIVARASLQTERYLFRKEDIALLLHQYGRRLIGASQALLYHDPTAWLALALV